MSCVAALTLFSATLHAAPAQESDAMAEAERLHREGQDRYDTADYAGAIERWTQAYGAVKKAPGGAAMQPFILYNIAAAREKEFEIEGNVAHLKAARTLLLNFESSIDETYADPAEAAAERTRVLERIEAIEARIAEQEAVPVSVPSPEPVVQPTENLPPEPIPPQTTDPEIRDPQVTDPQPEGPPSRGVDKRVVAGAVLVGAGGAAGAVLLAGIGIGAKANDIGSLAPDALDERERQFDRGRTGNTLAIVGAVAAPLLLGAGIALIVVAKRRSRTGNAAMRPRWLHEPTALTFRF